MKTFRIILILVLSIVPLLMIIPYNPTVGIIMRSLVSITGQGTCERAEEYKTTMFVCSETSSWLHFKGGTAFGNTYVTSKEKGWGDWDQMITHEHIHILQGEEYGWFLVLMLITNSEGECSTIEKEAGFNRGGYHNCSVELGEVKGEL